VLKVLQSLLDLQSVDTRLQDVRTRLAAFPKKSADLEARIAAAKAELDKSKAAQLATIKDRKKYELDVDQWKDRVKKYKDQSSQVKTNEAYKALQHEIQMAEDEIAKAEDRLLEQMVAGEEYDRKIKVAEKSLKEIEDSVRAERGKIEAEKTVAEKELKEGETERERAVSGIPENMMDHYDRIMKKHNNVALAEVRDEKCSACGMRVRPHVFQAMRRSSEEMFHCETCTRILYYLEPATSTVPATPLTQPQGEATSHSEN
jgi:hypothetical protein